MEEKSIKSATYSLPRVHFNGLAWFQRQKSSEHEVTEVVNIKLYGWWFSWKKVALVFLTTTLGEMNSEEKKQNNLNTNVSTPELILKTSDWF